MKTLTNALLVGLAVFVVSQTRAGDSEAAKKEMAQLQGEWSMVSGSANGQAMPDEMRKQMKRVCKGDEATTTMGAMVYLKAKITIDPSKKPKTIDYRMTEGVTKGKTGQTHAPLQQMAALGFCGSGLGGGGMLGIFWRPLQGQHCHSGRGAAPGPHRVAALDRGAHL